MGNTGCVLRFEKSKIANAKIYEDKRDFYCNFVTLKKRHRQKMGV